MNVTINAEQKLFVIHSSGGFSCFGFENCFRDSMALAERLGVKNLAPSPEQIGMLEQYENYIRLLEIARDSKRDLGTWYDPRTSKEVINVLEEARTLNYRVRIFTGDVDTGVDWLSEHGVVGRVGRSSGFIKVPLLIVGSDIGGESILDHCILRIVHAASKRELYRHPLYQAPALTCAPYEDKKLPFAVFDNGKLIARFKNEEKASRWISFMHGDRMTT